ncbi:MAG: hypothetical protein QOI51_1437, partial [Nocardioidaceae bacterium]|nr:hypothetical protein [Nocardioidaceae bacterium]
MTLSLAERHRQALLGGLATVATSLSLFPALQQKHYFIIGIGLTLVVVGIGMLVRQLHLPTVVAPVVQVVVVSELLLLVYGGYSKYGFIPTAKTFSTISRIISAGMDIANRYAAPVPRSPGLMLMTVGFIALVAIVVDLLAAGIGRAPLAGLALLALYSVPVAALPKGVPALAFIPGAAAFLVLLMVSERERLAHWGRHVARSTIRDHSETIDTSGLAMSGRRISVFAIAMAVVLPIVVPNFSHTLFHGQEGLGSGNGGSLSFNDPMVSLANSLHLRQPIDLIDVSSPSTEPSYLRLAVLDDPGPNAWTNSGVNLSTTVAADGALPPPVGLGTDVARVRRQMNISLTGDFSRASDVWLPVPFGLSRLNLRFEFGGQPSDFAYVPNDQTVTSRTSGALSEASTYTATYQDVEPTEQELRGAGQPPADIVSEFGRVPAGVPSIVGEEARNIT